MLRVDAVFAEELDEFLVGCFEVGLGGVVLDLWGEAEW